MGRHAALRALIIEGLGSHGSFSQVVLKHLPVECLYCECQEGDWKSCLRRIAEEKRGQRQLHQISICKTSTGDVFARLDVNHVIIDAASLSILVMDLKQAYDGIALPSAPSFSDHIAFVLKQQTAEAGNYWKAYLLDSPSCIVSGSRHLRASEAGLPYLKRASVPQIAEEEIRRFCKSQNITPPNLLQAAWALTLSHITGCQDILFAHVVSSRQATVPWHLEVVGPLLNVLISRSRISPSTRATNILAKMQQDYLDSLAYQYFDVQGILRAGKTKPVVNTLLNFRKATIGEKMVSAALQLDVVEALDPWDVSGLYPHRHEDQS